MCCFPVVPPGTPRVSDARVLVWAPTMMNRFESSPALRFGVLLIPLGAATAGWHRQVAAENQERLTRADIAVAEPLQVPLSAAKPAPDQPASMAAEGQPPAPQADPADTTSGAESREQAAPTGTGSPDPPAVRPSSPPRPAQAVITTADTKPKSGWLGLTVDDSLVTGRLVIVEVADPSPASSVSIRPQDVLLAIDGEPMQTADQLAAVLAAIPPDKQVRALIGRTDGVKEVTMTARVRPAVTQSPTAVAVAPPPAAGGAPVASRFSTPSAAAPALPATPQAATAAVAPAGPPPGGTNPPAVTDSTRSRFGKMSSQPPATLPSPQAAPLRSPPTVPAVTAGSPASVFQGRTALGVRTVAIDAATQARYRLSEPRGAYVLGVVDSLPASQAGLPPGSVIVAFDNRPVRSPAELNQLVTESTPGRLVALEYVLPGGEARRADIELKALEPALERALIGVPTAAPRAAPGASRTVQRPVSPAPREPLPTGARVAASTDNHAERLLRQELSLLREEVLRLRSRLDAIERVTPGGRGRGNTLR